MKYCKNCLYPDTKPELTLDNNEICNACRSSQLKEKINWNERYDELKNILDRYKKEWK